MEGGLQRIAANNVAVAAAAAGKMWTHDLDARPARRRS